MSYYNPEHYSDPTAGQAVSNVSRNSRSCRRENPFSPPIRTRSRRRKKASARKTIRYFARPVRVSC